MGHIKPGDIVQGPRWPEPVEVKLVEDMGGYVRIVGQMRVSGQHVDHMIPKTDLETIRVAPVRSDFTAPARDLFLRLEALRYRFASVYDPLLAMNISKVDPLPHQIEAVYGYVLNLPRIRFLIADDPGAGKTIMAGLVIKELKLRRLAHRILIVVPGHLKDQWRREMKERFEEHFVVVDRSTMEALFGENVWLRENQVITSMDFAKREDVLGSLAAAHFDLVIVDEAHKMSAYRYGDKLERTARYRLGEVLSQITTHMLFLTATPHKGDPENFRLFLDLLVPGFFATEDLLQESIRNRDNPLFIRRMKEDLRDFEGKPLFLPRHVRTIPFDLGQESPQEKALYNELSRYVQTQYNKALTEDKRRNVAFALVILQRRFASSVYALYRSLERRKKRLEDLLRMSDPERRKVLERPTFFDLEETEDESEAERWQKEEIWETLTVAKNRQELEREIATVERLLHQAKRIIQSGEEAKLRHFRQALENLERRFPGEKILIFTESRDTLEYLEQRLRQWGYSVCTIHGGMKLEDRIHAEAVFRNEAQVMVATEAAGEGINLQFCHLMINYDLPWNPNRLEQRMGRIHRYGQTREVYIFNLVAADTREGRVMQRLFDKLEEIRQALGSDKVFDVLGEVYYGKNLAQLMLEAAASARSIDEILQEIDIRVDEEYLRRVRENLGESLATRYIDYTRMREMADQAREHRLIPEYTEAFFKKGWQAAGGRYRERQDGFLTVESIPAAIRRVAEEDDFRKQFGTLLNRYPKITFDRDVAFRHPEAEFVSFGHPLFEALLRWVEKTLSDALHRGAVFTDPDGRLDGVLLFYEGEITDGMGQVAGKRLLAFFADRNTGDIRPVNPAILWDLLEAGEAEASDVSLEAMKNRALPTVMAELERYREEQKQERERQARIKEKYGVRSLEHLIVDLDGDLIHLYDRRDRGEKVDLVIHNKEEQKRRYQQALQDLKEEIERERMLTLTTPRFVTALRVVPARVAAEAMSEDPRVEAVGMKVAMQYERDQGREPEDVSAQNLGFDIRSTDPEAKRKRYIEVKARAGIGPVALTQNEWFKARRFGEDYYLYIVLNAATQKPDLYIIQNPAARLKPDEVVEVRYRVEVDEILAGVRAGV